MFLSIVVPTYNRASLLEKFMASIQSQTLSTSCYEVLVIDNGSTDNTSCIIHKLTSFMPNLHYFYEPNPGLHAGRHRGYTEARGDILVYADDDIEAFPTWLETIQKCFQDPSIAMVGGKNIPKFESTPPNWLTYMWESNPGNNKVLGYLSILDLGNQPKTISPRLIYGCNFSIRLKILEEAGGFHPDSMPQNLIRYRGDGESYVSQYISSQDYKALYHPEASVYHWVSNNRMTIEYFCRRAYNQGISDSYTQLRERNGLAPSPTLDLSKSASREQPIYYKFRRRIVTQASNILKQFKSLFCIGLKNISETERTQLKAKIHEAYQAGYSFHQQEVANDSRLLEWVLKPNYWDSQLPYCSAD